MIQSGTTAYADMYYFEEEIARATREAGHSRRPRTDDHPVPGAGRQNAGRGHRSRDERFIKEWSKDDLIVPAIAPHSMYTLDAATLKEIRAVADPGARTGDHSPGRNAGRGQSRARQVQERPRRSFLESIGFWGARTIAAHGVHVTPADIQILARRHVGVSHNPESNMKLASGTSPVPALQTAGVVVGLGTDGAASNNDLDMFEAMRQAAFLHKLDEQRSERPAGATALRMATIDGARVLGLDRQIGSLETGQARRPARRVDAVGAPDADVRSAVTPGLRHPRRRRADGVVNGKMLMRDRKMLTLDEARRAGRGATVGGKACGAEVRRR